MVKLKLLFKLGNIIILKDDSFKRIYIYNGNPFTTKPILSFGLPFRKEK